MDDNNTLNDGHKKSMARPFLTFLAILSMAICSIALARFGILGDVPQTWVNNASATAKHSLNRIPDMGEVITSEFQSRIRQVTIEPEPPLVTSAREQIGVTVSYDPAYVALDYPMGDVPMATGVCTDVVVRAYREQGYDLQALVHEDMNKAWNEYPKIWGLTRPDPNIDHRRVPNLRTFFERHGESLPITQNAADYVAGDVVTWKINGRPHIGIVSNKRLADGTPLIIHNIGSGTKENKFLFFYDITGHYRYG